MHALLIAYGLEGASAVEHAEFRDQIAPALAAVPGLVSLTWLANDDTGRYGGFYLFETKSAFDRFVASELFETLRAHASVGDMTASDYSTNGSPTTVTRGPAQERAPLAGDRKVVLG